MASFAVGWHSMRQQLFSAAVAAGVGSQRMHKKLEET